MPPRPDQPEPAIIEPKTIRLIRRPVAKRVLLFPLREHLEAYLALTGAPRARRRKFGPTWYHPPVDSQRPGAVGPFLGASFTAAVVEELIALGARELVFFGIAGSLEKTLRIGDAALAEAAFVDEGASRQYRPDLESFSADGELLARLKSHLSARGHSLPEATVWTTDGLYRETPSKMEAFLARGCSLVEMEISTMYCVADYRGVAAAAVVVVSDELFSGLWRAGYQRPRYKRATGRVINALVDW